MSKIRDLKSEVSALLSRFSKCPSGYIARPIFERPEREDRRSIREDADASYFRPEEGCFIRIDFVPLSPAPQEQPPKEQTNEPNGGLAETSVARPAPFVPVSVEAARVILALDEAERDPGKAFVAIKTFRDVILPRAGFDPSSAAAALNAAIGAGLILTSKIPNPHRPDHDTTAVRLSRSDRRVEALLRRPNPSPQRFAPLDLGPVSASEIVIRNRR